MSKKVFATDFQEEQYYIKKSKPYLRFSPGDIVYFKTDFERTNPMIVKSLLDITYDEDYLVQWFDTQKSLKVDFFFDIALVADERNLHN